MATTSESTSIPLVRQQQLPPSADTALPQIQVPKSRDPSSPEPQRIDARRSSFNFLRRTSEGKMSKKQKALRQEELLRQQRQEAMLPKQPPRLPSHSPLPTINTFGGEDVRPDSVAIATGQAAVYNSSRRNPSHGSLQTRSMNFSRVSPHQHPNPIKQPPVPGNDGDQFDPYPRTESMTHRGRYSYASSAVSSINSPRRVRRRKDPTPFNILVIGAKNSGKTSFINFLHKALALPANKRQQSPSAHRPRQDLESLFSSEYIETEIDNERIGVTIWDSQGLEKNIVDLQLREMATFLESKFEETFTEEQKVVRALGVWDTYIHCAFLVLDPVRLDSNVATAAKSKGNTSKFGPQQRLVGGLDEDFDLQVLRTLQGKTTVIPVISKADTITTKHMSQLKKMVWDSLKQAKLDPLDALDLDESDSEALDERDEDALLTDDEDKDSPMLNKLKDSTSSSEDNEERSDTASTNPSSPPRPSPDAKRPGHARKVSAMSATIATSPSSTDAELPYLPMSIISPDIYEPDVIGRQFPWGFADPYNVDHCDFTRLKESVFREWRTELREASRERWYEDWRTSRLNRSGIEPRRSHTGDGSRRSPGPGSLMPRPNGNVRATSADGYSSENTKPTYQPYRAPVQS